MDPYKELEQFVSEGYFSSKAFKDNAIELSDHYDENNDMLLNRKGASGESQPYEEVSWSEYFRDFLTDKCDTFVINVKRSHRISREAVLAAEFRLLSLIEGIQENGTDEGIYIDVISQTAEFLREFRHQIFGPDPDEKIKTPKLSTSLTVIQLGYLLRMMKETVFENDQEDTIFLSRFGALFSTPRSEEISINTLTHKTRNPEEKEKEKVYELIVKLQEKIRDDKNLLKS